MTARAWRLQARYAADLPPRMYHPQRATPVPASKTLAFNDALAQRLGLPADIPAEVLAGIDLPPGAQPIAQAYAGHQFGNFVPQLGDGRALLLGEQITPDGARFDIQLKGSGPTPYSRGGDGRAWLGPVLREYIMSEAMAALGLPTTRALAAVSTGDEILRERPLPGAVLTRVAASHIRVGTFQYAAVRGDVDTLEALTAHVIARHYPNAETPEDLLEAVIDAQAALIAGWMSVGFIHGVMNTDNCAISGETIDYGPCAFMEGYHPARVFSSIDRHGRYAYANQPKIAAWNLAQFASCLVPLMPDEDAAVERFTTMIDSFGERFTTHWRARFAAKLGLEELKDDDITLVEDLLHLMARDNLDFTRSFAALEDPATLPGPEGANWRNRWQARTPKPVVGANPTVVPRLHQIEAAITAAVAGNMAPFATLLTAATTPFAPRDQADAMTQPAAKGQEVTRTFCGT